MYDQDATKVQDLVDTGDLKFWIIKMMLRNYRSKTSPCYKYRKDGYAATVGALDQGMERTRIVRTSQEKICKP